MNRGGPRVLAPPPLIYAPALALGLGLSAFTGDLHRPPPAAQAVAYVLLAVGVVLTGAFLRAFRRARTSVDFGSATTLVTAGPYRISRNPGYVGLALVYAGAATLTSGWWAFATLLPALVVIDRYVVRPEERHLAERFGPAYDAYRQRTRRWL